MHIDIFYSQTTPLVASRILLYLQNCHFVTVVIPAISVPFGLFIVYDMVQDTTVQIKGSWRFLNVTHVYVKNT